MTRGILPLLMFAAFLAGDASAAGDFRQDRALAENFRLTRDTIGYDLPTAMVFIPSPGTRPPHA